ncbi:inorganic phosphate transporter [Halosquirtibacter xylanolyticus]|uniref:inorganic phosphate transporter n=1 Tax=Halosquirtibacter xylanolyticus TaxID=3374599 RepID=UPI003749A1B1|nr:inorganic phosphate transporter [Prolixibacteraceae bacterium]
METFYLTLVVILFALAISDLIVGVSNDAVNFLNSAIGSKAAPKWVIFAVASLGILVGATFSSGMMEVARKGIMNPNMFMFNEIMIIFVTVMITDIILLDLFNSLGLPTSTTVSIVFELLGSSVAVALVKISNLGQSIADIHQYINTDKALAIIFGILFSVVIAFSIGALVQWITRLIFTFKFDKKIKYYGSIFGGLCLAFITYFILIKGAKGASWIDPEHVKYIKSHTTTIISICFISCTVILQLISMIFKKVNILKVVVLIGTFALAMAFAGNDLVNFIGVPLAGFESFNAWRVSGLAPDAMSMSILTKPVETETYMLLIAGIIMIVTLITSKKAKKVIATSLNLSNQGESEERFESSAVSRAIVRSSISVSQGLGKIVAEGIKGRIRKRFTKQPKNEDDTAFDLIRASVNLVVASILISIGTSYKLPLSTTYVTFMVAMGTSLADKAWDRESAVYRISGVFTVVGGWFMTAIVAFSSAAIIGATISVVGDGTVFLFLALAIFLVFKSTFKSKKDNDNEEEEELTEEVLETTKVLEKSKQRVTNSVLITSKGYLVAIESFLNEDRKNIKEILEEVDYLSQKTKKWKNNVNSVVLRLQADSVETGHYYVQIVDYLRELSHSLNYIITPLYEHISNNHRPFVDVQAEELIQLVNKVNDFYNSVIHVVKEERFDKIDELINERGEVLEFMSELEKLQIKRIKKKEVNTRNSVLFFNILSESKNLLFHSVNIAKAYRDFVHYSKKSI